VASGALIAPNYGVQTYKVMSILILLTVTVILINTDLLIGYEYFNSLFKNRLLLRVGMVCCATGPIIFHLFYNESIKCNRNRILGSLFSIFLSIFMFLIYDFSKILIYVILIYCLYEVYGGVKQKILDKNFLLERIITIVLGICFLTIDALEGYLKNYLLIAGIYFIFSEFINLEENRIINKLFQKLPIVIIVFFAVINNLGYLQ